METIDVFTLPDRAIALFYLLKERGSMSIDAIESATGKSPATIYRALAELQDAGFETGLARRPRVERPKKAFSVKSHKAFSIAESTQLTKAA